jgi:hypothetical protein
MKVSMWGPTSSGKTTYIAMVYGSVLMTDKSPWLIRPNDFPAREFVRENYSLLRKGIFPPQTSLMEPVYYNYLFRQCDEESEEEFKPKSGWAGRLSDILSFSPIEELDDPYNLQDGILVQFADVAGEAYNSVRLDDPLWDNLASSNALICLIDPNDASDHFDIALNLLSNLDFKMRDGRMGGDTWLPQYVAFCFSQCDTEAFRHFINDPKSIVQHLQQTQNLNIDRLLRQYVNKERLKYFTVSAIGTEVSVNGGTIQNPHLIKPINVLEPLKWLFRVAGR